MSESPLITWLNSDVKLSKNITSIPDDFFNGYYFAEILHKFKVIPNFSSYRNSSDKKDISKNYQYLTKALGDLGIKFNDERRNLIIQKKKGISEQVLFQIKQALDKRFISKETLIPKLSNELAKIYNQSLFANDNDKYYKDLLNKQALTGKIKLTPLQKFSKTLNDDYTKEILKNIEKDNEYLQGKHIEMLNSIRKKEKDKEMLEKEKDATGLKNWKHQMVIKKKFEQQLHDEFWSQVEFYKNEVLKSFQNSQKEQVESINNFNNILSRLGLDIADSNIKKKRNDFISTEIILRRIQEKVKKEEQSRKDKQKRQRKIQNEQNKLMNNSSKRKSISRVSSQKKNSINLNSIREEGNKKRNEFEHTKFIHQKYLIKQPEPVIHEEEKIILPYRSRDDFFDSDYFFTQLNKETLKTLALSKENKDKKRNKIKDGIDTIINHILDITDEAYKFQLNNKKELIDSPNWEKWMDLFINNQSVFSLQEEENKVEDDTEINPNEMNDTSNESVEKAKCEFMDYISYLGAWGIKMKKKVTLQLYDILGNDVAFMLAGGKVQIGGLKESQLKSMTNEAFEPGKGDLENLNLPTENTVNPYLGEIIEFCLEIKYDTLNSSRNVNCSTESHIIKNNTENEKNSEVSKENIKKEEIKENEKENDLGKNNSQSQIEGEKRLNTETVEEENNQEKEEPQYTFNHIPIKLCFIGYPFSGRKTQAKLITEMYPSIKSYCLETIINNALLEYEKIITPIEKHPKFKSMKKNQIEQLKVEKAAQEEQFKYIRSIIEPFAKKEIEDISDENKMNLLLYYVKQDFPLKSQIEVQNEINERKERLEQIENELSKIKEEQAKKPKAKVKEEQNFINEKNKLIQDSYSGFIFVDFPQNYSQFKLMENKCTGFVEEISKVKTEKEILHDYLELSIDRPFHTNIIKEIPKSLFDSFCIFEVEEEECLRRLRNRKLDPNTNIIYHMEDNPPPENDKKLNERLIELTEPTEEKVKEESKYYDENYSQMKSFLDLFKNVYIVKNNIPSEIVKDINDNIIVKVVAKFEKEKCYNKLSKISKSNILTDNDFEPNKTGNILNNVGISNNHQSNNNATFITQNLKFQKRLNEAKKKLGCFNFLLSKWDSFISSYSSNLSTIFINISNIKDLIISQMSKIQKKFIAFLNTPSNKKTLINIFCNKYTSYKNEFDGKIPYNKIVKNEFNSDLNELTDGLWSIINKRKNEAIEERKKIMSCGFIEKQMNYFYVNIENMFLKETEKFLLSVNIIKEFYYNLLPENLRTVQNPFINKIESIKIKEILQEVNSLDLINKTLDSNKIVTYPKIEKIYLNCMKIIFKYDYLIRQLEGSIKSLNTMNSSINLNTSQNINDVSVISHGKKRRFHKGQSRAINHSNSNIIGNESQFSEENREAFNIPDEVKNSIESEKGKYKYRISILKSYAINTLNNMLKVADDVYSILDEWIIDSVRLQNNMMNKLISHFRDIVDNGKLMLWDFELDRFNIYKEVPVRFENDDFFELNNRNSDEYDEYLNREINYGQYIELLYKMYYDIKLYALQNEFISKSTLEEIFIKKNLITTSATIILKSPFYKLSFHHYNKLFNKLLIKNKDENEQKVRDDLINLNHLFAIFSVLQFDVLENENIILNEIKNRIKNHCFLSKEDFYSIHFWFETKEEKLNSKFYEETEKYSSVKEFLYDIFKNSKEEVNIIELLDIFSLKFVDTPLTEEVEEEEKIVYEENESPRHYHREKRKMIKKWKKLYNQYLDLLIR